VWCSLQKAFTAAVPRSRSVRVEASFKQAAGKQCSCTWCLHSAQVWPHSRTPDCCHGIRAGLHPLLKLLCPASIPHRHKLHCSTSLAERLWAGPQVDYEADSSCVVPADTTRRDVLQLGAAVLSATMLPSAAQAAKGKPFQGPALTSTAGTVWTPH
jgi:hypothetical protein